MRRNGVELGMAILEALDDESLPITHIMYRANVNCTALKGVISELIKLGYVQAVPVGLYFGSVRCKYRSTVSGKELLRRYAEFKVLGSMLNPDSRMTRKTGDFKREMPE